MLTGQIRNDIDQLWEKFWTGGVTNPLTVIEQISYLMFARMLDERETQKEHQFNTMKASGLNPPPMSRMYADTPEGQELRWKNFKSLKGDALVKRLRDQVYPGFARLKVAEDGINPDMLEFMVDADLAVRNPAVLQSAIEMIEKLPLNQSDIKGDIYEYLLSKLTTAGINGQFRTPRHIIDTMIELVAPKPTETVADPACGTAGFLARTMEYLNRKHSSEYGVLTDEEGNKHYTGDQLTPYRSHIESNMFWGFDFDDTMLRVSAMNMMLHGVSGANIHYQDSLNKNMQQHFPKQVDNYFDVILANPPFKGSLDSEGVNPKILSQVKTKKTELLFVAHILNMLSLGGRSATIVPDGVLFGSSKAHQQLRKHLVDDNQLEAVISLPSGVFKPYAGVSTAILIFTKGGNTNKVWFYDVQRDGFSLDDKRTAIKDNDLPDVISQYHAYQQVVAENGSLELWQDKTKPAFLVDAADIQSNKYDLSINRYKEVIYEEETYDPPKEILGKLKTLEQEILADLNELEKML
ncbi:type I restriction-modification system subunit M [Neiella marina]|uniref:site-specific DNA-methyltransferase (adenine-specific) n=1 Tax=Neiella holothuriorum TaxID=2870530 RepID=A0ABS7ED82_9GAMM|nr:class I SAM-dependent DNA methyltransferase [Neiella holothuriorum]MBW8190292.1 type I restriction-modification system subunit M [Neiella holothuriorum]